MINIRHRPRRCCIGATSSQNQSIKLFPFYWGVKLKLKTFILYIRTIKFASSCLCYYIDIATFKWKEDSDEIYDNL